jgi:D-alanyl-D-alanine carboxypeptidase
MMNEQSKRNWSHITRTLLIHTAFTMITTYTTPADMAKIARYCFVLSLKLLELTSIKHYKFRDEPKELILHNTNKLLWRYPGTDGLKTGTTSKALEKSCFYRDKKTISV